MVNFLIFCHSGAYPEVRMEITRYKALGGESKVVAFFSVKIPEFMGMTINNCRLIRTNNGGKFIGLPQQQYEENGETKYAPYIWFDKEILERFQKGVMKAIDEYVKTNNPQPAAQMQAPAQQPMQPAYAQPAAPVQDNLPF